MPSNQLQSIKENHEVKHFLWMALLFATQAHGEIQVAFFECYDWYGNLVQLEKAGRYCHVAISCRSGWLHAHPARGVEVKSDLKQLGIGKVALILLDETQRPLDSVTVDRLLGLPYDQTFHWSTEKGTYCSKLVGKLLHLKPEEMVFETPYWEKFHELPTNELGLSPDDVFRQLRELGWVKSQLPKEQTNEAHSR